MGVVASPSDRRLVRKRDAEIDALVRESVVREDPPLGGMSPTVAAPPSGSTGIKNVDHCELGAVGMESLTRMAEAAVASHTAAERQKRVVAPRDSVDVTRSVTSLRALMPMPHISPV